MSQKSSFARNRDSKLRVHPQMKIILGRLAQWLIVAVTELIKTQEELD